MKIKKFMPKIGDYAKIKNAYFFEIKEPGTIERITYINPDLKSVILESGSEYRIHRLQLIPAEFYNSPFWKLMNEE